MEHDPVITLAKCNRIQPRGSLSSGKMSMTFKRGCQFMKYHHELVKYLVIYL